RSLTTESRNWFGELFAPVKFVQEPIQGESNSTAGQRRRKHAFRDRGLLKFIITLLGSETNPVEPSRNAAPRRAATSCCSQWFRGFVALDILRAASGTWNRGIVRTPLVVNCIGGPCPWPPRRE